MGRVGARALITDVLRTEPQFRLLFGGQVLSIIGDRVMLVALPFAVLEAGGSLADVGLVVGAQLLPFLVFALIGGAFSDRSDRRRGLVAPDALRLVVPAPGGGPPGPAAAAPPAPRGSWSRRRAGRCWSPTRRPRWRSASSPRSTAPPMRSSSPPSPACSRRRCRTLVSSSPPTRCAG